MKKNEIILVTFLTLLMISVTSFIIYQKILPLKKSEIPAEIKKEVSPPDALFIIRGGMTEFSPQRKCARDSKNNIYCVVCKDSPFQIYLLKSSDFGKTWQEEKVNEDSSEGQFTPSIAIDSKDQIHVVWTGFGWGKNKENTNIQYRKKTKEGWQTQESITDVNFDQFDPVIAVDSKDNLHLVWYGRGFGKNSQVFNIFYRERDEKGWKDLELVTDSNFIQFSPTLAIDSKDEIHVVWSGFGWGENKVFSNIQYKKKTSIGWGAQESVTDIANYQYLPSLAIDSKDNLHLVWDGRGWGQNSYYDNIQYRKRTKDGWQKIESVSDRVLDQCNPSISVDEQDQIHVVWYGFGWGQDKWKFNLLHRKKTESGWEEIENLTDAKSHQPGSNLLWARWPEVEGKKTNVLKGFFLIWTSKGEGVKFLYKE